MTRSPLCAALAAACLCLAATPGRAADDAPDLPLEELLQADVQTASRKSQRLQDVAAAVYVVTREDIERAGITALPEALRMVPGMQVARLSNNRWAVTARGFNGRFANKLLVLMDGRSIYSPLFSGVLWEMEDTMLEDVERIEVIRGPGAALWGANAVNGVINIITRHARDTRGSLAVAAVGTEEPGRLSLRHGFAAGPGQVRLWAKAFERSTSTSLDGTEGNDDWRSLRAGLRGDWAFDASRRLTVSGGVFDSPTGDRWRVADVTAPTGYTLTDVTQVNRGAHLLARHEWLGDGGSQTALQAYVERQHVDASVLAQRRTTVDLDFQQRLLLGDRHDVVWGLGWRTSFDQVSSSGTLVFDPDRRRWNLASAFLHDEITLLPGRLKAVIGARLEHNSVTGDEPQPNLRAIWTPAPTQTFWAAVAGAARTPSRAELDASVDLAVIPAQPPQQPAVLLRSLAPDGNRLDAERVESVELGWRQQVHEAVSTDLTVFSSRYRKLLSGRTGTTSFVPAPVPYVLQTTVRQTAGNARVHGAELAVDWRADARWRWQLAWTLLGTSVQPTSDDPVEAASLAREMASLPRHQVSLRSGWTASDRLRLDAWFRHVDTLPGSTGTPRVDGYNTLDLRLGWRFAPGWDLALTGRNLLQARHLEFQPDSLPSQPQYVERSADVRLRWQF